MTRAFLDVVHTFRGFGVAATARVRRQAWCGALDPLPRGEHMTVHDSVATCETCLRRYDEEVRGAGAPVEEATDA